MANGSDESALPIFSFLLSTLTMFFFQPHHHPLPRIVLPHIHPLVHFLYAAYGTPRRSPRHRQNTPVEMKICSLLMMCSAAIATVQNVDIYIRFTGSEAQNRHEQPQQSVLLMHIAEHSSGKAGVKTVYPTSSGAACPSGVGKHVVVGHKAEAGVQKELRGRGYAGGGGESSELCLASGGGFRSCVRCGQY